MKQFTLPFIFFLLISHSIHAQDNSPELITDRPDQTESASVVPRGFIQVETGFLMEFESTKDYTYRSFAYNTTLLRYGLLDNFELRLGMEYLGEYSDPKTSSPVTLDGFSPLNAGFKIKIAEEDGWKPQFALLGGIALPFTASKDMAVDYTAGNMRLSFAHTLSDRFSIGYNIGVEWNETEPFPFYFYSLALGVGIIDKMGMFLEVYGLVPESFDDTEHMVDAGVTYLVLPNLQLDISGGIALNDVPVQNFVSAGLSFRLPE